MMGEQLIQFKFEEVMKIGNRDQYYDGCKRKESVGQWRK